jgi:hypothetical protein
VLTGAFRAVPDYLDFFSVVPKVQIAPVVISLSAPEKWSPVFRTNGGSEEKPKVHYLPLPLAARRRRNFLR